MHCLIMKMVWRTYRNAKFSPAEVVETVFLEKAAFSL